MHPAGDMTEGSMKGVETEEFVEATHDYSYQRDDRTFSMTKGEIFLLIKRASPDWWQVGPGFVIVLFIIACVDVLCIIPPFDFSLY